MTRGCGICGTHEPPICVDHDHTSGKVRGGLCHKCNSALGFLNDDVERLRSALDYLSAARA